MLVSNTQTIVEALDGEYTAFKLQITELLEKQSRN